MELQLTHYFWVELEWEWELNFLKKTPIHPQFTINSPTFLTKLIYKFLIVGKIIGVNFDVIRWLYNQEQFLIEQFFAGTIF